MDDLISRKALIADLRTAKGLGKIIAETLVRFLKKQPTVDAVEVVRCKECKHRGRETYCPMCFEEWYEIDEGDGYYDSDFTIHDRTIDDGFCDRGEREDNEERNEERNAVD